MLFNSLTFLVCLAVVLLAYYRLGLRAQNWLLLAASYLFYAWWDWRFLGLLVLSTVIDYYCGQGIEDARSPGRRKTLVWLSIAMNMGVLGFFKYYDFFAESTRAVLATIGFQADLPTLHLLLPVGISFYTFLSMSYTIDVYRGHVKACRDPVDLMLYVSFFPHLVAGPIVRADALIPQIQKARTIRRDEVLNGIWLCLMGYVKKVVIADRLSQVADWGFSGSSLPYQDANAWLFLYAFAFQIYGDFAGYSDIARGVSKLMGFELPHNFKAPYLVSNPSSFWQHWHISLSVWLRDYIYIPLGGNRAGTLKTYRNLMATMLLGGLWHGAGVAYLLWGFYHGALLAVHRFFTGPRPARSSTTMALRGVFLRVPLVLGFFHLTCIGWLFFRAGAVPQASAQWHLLGEFQKALLQPMLQGVSPLLQPVLLLGGVALFFQWKHEAMDRFSSWRVSHQIGAVAAALCAIMSLGVFENSSFIYFQF
jgi:alginate O-acetyltransferase complex protein AlgI